MLSGAGEEPRRVRARVWRVEAGFVLGAAVARFFENGGSDAWVVGLPDGVPLSAGLECLDAVETLSLLCLPGETDIMSCSLGSSMPSGGVHSVIDPPGTEVTDARATSKLWRRAGAPTRRSTSRRSRAAILRAGQLPGCMRASTVSVASGKRPQVKKPSARRGHARRRRERRRKLEAELSRRERDPEISGQGCPGMGREDDSGCGARSIPSGSTSRYGGSVSTSSTASTVVLSGPSSSPTTSRRGRGCDSRSPYS